MEPQNGNNIGINLGVSSDTVKQLGEMILQILDSEVDQSTMQIALGVLERGSSINGASISNCHINMQTSKATGNVAEDF